MTKKILANVVQQVHWDPEWYFTEEDTTVQFAYNTRDLLRSLKNGTLKQFYLDGRTDALIDYLNSHKEDIDLVKELVASKKLVIGPFHAQLDCLISSGEAIIRNLNMGIELADELGGASKLAWLPDSFGHGQDFPKIFNGFGIKDFIFRRGMGDEHQLPLDFNWESNDGSSVVTNVLQAGYGFATPAFISGKMTSSMAKNYQGKDLNDEFLMLANGSTLENEFLLPIGFDLNPAIENFDELLQKYSDESEKFNFEETTFDAYMKKIRENGNLKTYRGEFNSAQYHRMHRSLFSARADIKTLQDQTERILTYEVQPLMAMADRLGIKYDKGLLDRAWDLLLRSQTHSSATNTDKTNELIKTRTARAYNIAESTKVFIMRKIAVTIPKTTTDMPLVVFNTLPEKRDITDTYMVYTKSKNFKIMFEGKEVPYTIISDERRCSGIQKKDPSKMDQNKFFHATKIAVSFKDVPGMSYQCMHVIDEVSDYGPTMKETAQVIENKNYKISYVDGQIQVTDKIRNVTYKQAIYLEESGDEGDNYDYSNPDHDMTIIDTFINSAVSSYDIGVVQEMIIKGTMLTPANLEERADRKTTTLNNYEIKITLKEDNNLIFVKGKIDNQANNHRIRLVVKTPSSNEYSIAGTQFGNIKRETEPENLMDWRSKKFEDEPIEDDADWLEEPTPSYPFLNYVALEQEKEVVTVFTRSSKEYEVIGEGYSDIAITLFRSVGHLGLPDLNRRPGRASGLQEKLFPSPLSQLIGENEFEVAIAYYEEFDGNKIGKDYVNYAVDRIYFQNQKHERVVFPICFLDVGALPNPVPENHTNLELIDSEATYGTYHKSTRDEGYVLRIYNNSDKVIKAGTLVGDFKTVKYTDLLCQNDVEASKELGEMRPGEIRTIKVFF